MNRYFVIFTLLLIVQSCIIPTNFNEKSQYALNENFGSNNVGWIEEENEYHEFEIKNGYYFMNSKDTSFNYTSTSPLDDSYLYGLKNFELETTFRIVKKSPKKTQIGVFFISGVFRYDFILDVDGKGIVTVYDYNTQKETILVEKEASNIYLKELNSLKFTIVDKQFSLFINDSWIGDGTVKAGSWQDMRVFITSGTDIMMKTFTILRK